MKYHAIPAAQLRSDLIEAWSRIQRAAPALNSPYFRPEFAQAVASVRDSAEVAVLEDDGAPVGFLPYDRSKRNVGRPIAPEMTDFQAAIVQRGVAWNAERLVRDCGLRALYFDHLVVGQPVLEPYHWLELPSPYLDLSDGFGAYREKRAAMGEGHLKGVLRKARKMGRELGPLRLEMGPGDQRVFRTLIAWKTDQYFRTKARNVFAQGWTVRLLQRLLEEHSEALSGVLSVLFAGERIVSIRLGMTSFGVYHDWFPAYDVEAGKYSPGLVHLVRMAQASSELGITRIDLGRGPEAYKMRFATDATAIAEAAVDLRPFARPLNRLWFRTEHFVRSSRLERPVRFVVRNLRALSRLAQAGTC